MTTLPESLVKALLAYDDPLAVFTWQGDNADLVAKEDDLALARRHLTPEQKLELDRKLADLGFTQLERAEMIGCTQGRVSQLGSISNVKTNIAYIPDFRVKVTPEMRRQIAARVATGGAGRPGGASPGPFGNLRAARLASGASTIYAEDTTMSELEHLELDDCHLIIHRALIRLGRELPDVAKRYDYLRASYTIKYLLGLVTADEAERQGREA